MTKLISAAEVKLHNKEEDCWCIIHGKVYDCTKFLDDHPGGGEVIAECAGTDATEAFDEIGHSDDANKLLVDLYIGNLEKDPLAQAEGASKKTEEPGLVQSIWSAVFGSS
ncbi:cytochrome b5 [Basidiobolus meristosporus CBS 931.73]|uniref:Cytochrome b5 n=1 Tax=Basidiobolus meristosporus CBS 931.73 TaxID=1314790 RepID=A0A1Y1Z6K7_9FUNG|nr:cytochrome b5 [Basidiobolus meristosporus CBS 931.73]|eukprot:ORY05889.1 cytochrome b5 [Basidiobolus meristosporus CBS 931.73]